MGGEATDDGNRREGGGCGGRWCVTVTASTAEKSDTAEEIETADMSANSLIQLFR